MFLTFIPIKTDKLSAGGCKSSHGMWHDSFVLSGSFIYLVRSVSTESSHRLSKACVIMYCDGIQSEDALYRFTLSS